MTQPRKRPPNAHLFTVAVQGRQITVEQYARLLDAYERDHPGSVPPRAGIRGNLARLGTPGLPDDWERPYLPLLDEPGPGDAADA